jgi:hypothetical protein
MERDTLSKAALIQAKMLAHAKEEILGSGDLVTSNELARLLGVSEKRLGGQLNRWKREKAIFAIQHEGSTYYPLYLFNSEDYYHPHKVVAQILKIFGESRNEWSVVFWFAGLNGFLDARRPKDLLLSEPELLIEAARDEIAGIQHG